MFKRMGHVLIIVLVATMMLTSLASADSPRDKLVGSGQFTYGSFNYHYNASAHSGANGEDPQGQLVFYWGDWEGEGKVTCLNVNGNTAVAVARLDEPLDTWAANSDFYLYVKDNGAPGNSPDDEMSAVLISTSMALPPVTTCWNVVPWASVQNGNFVIHDALND